MALNVCDMGRPPMHYRGLKQAGQSDEVPLAYRTFRDKQDEYTLCALLHRVTRPSQEECPGTIGGASLQETTKLGKPAQRSSVHGLRE